MDISDLALITAALGAGAFAKGAIGLGLPLLALPIMAARFGLPHAIVVVSIPIIVSNVWQIWQYRRSWSEIPFMPRVIIGGIAGLVVGTLLISQMPLHIAKLVLGSALLAYVATRLVSRGRIAGIAQWTGFDWAAGLVSGLLQGASGMSAPPLIALLHARGLARGAFILGMSIMLGMYAVFQAPVLVLSGLATPQALVQGCLALLPMALAMPVGAFMGRVFGPVVFDRIIMCVVVLIGANLVMSALGLY